MKYTEHYLEKILVWYVNLLKEHFERSKDFYDAEDDIYHPGEYGRYREEASREFIEFTIPGRMSTGEGFIANSLNPTEISTQCDIIVYDKSAPQFKDSHIRIFPIETVAAIGEVKSTLNTTKQVTDTLIKLAQNKAIRKKIDRHGTTVVYREFQTDQDRTYYLNIIKQQLREVSGRTGSVFSVDRYWIARLIRLKLGKINQIEYQHIENLSVHKFFSVREGKAAFLLLIEALRRKRFCDFNPVINHHDHVMSFLICNEITLKNKKKLMENIEKAYSDNGIDVEDRHNMILSIKDGLFLYYDQIDKSAGNVMHWAYPKMRGFTPLKQRFIPRQKDDEYYHFKVFSQQIFNGVADTTILHPEPSKHYYWPDESKLNFLEL